jgi:hypothetical protein
MLKVVLKGTQAEAEAAADAVGRALCPDETHDGPCNTPWTVVLSRLEDTRNEVDAAEWRELLADGSDESSGSA